MCVVRAAPPIACGGGDQPVVARADDDGVVAAHWPTFIAGGWVPLGAWLFLPVASRDGLGRSPHDGLHETRRAAGAGRS
jgi:hypothetical protein